MKKSLNVLLFGICVFIFAGLLKTLISFDGNIDTAKAHSTEDFHLECVAVQDLYPTTIEQTSEALSGNAYLFRDSTTGQEFIVFSKYDDLWERVQFVFERKLD